MLAVDKFAVFFKLLFLGIAVLIILASTDYVSRFRRFQGEYYALILLSASTRPSMEAVKRDIQA